MMERYKNREENQRKEFQKKHSNYVRRIGLGLRGTYYFREKLFTAPEKFKYVQIPVKDLRLIHVDLMQSLEAANELADDYCRLREDYDLLWQSYQRASGNEDLYFKSLVQSGGA